MISAYVSHVVPRSPGFAGGHVASRKPVTFPTVTNTTTRGFRYRRATCGRPVANRRVLHAANRHHILHVAVPPPTRRPNRHDGPLNLPVFEGSDSLAVPSTVRRGAGTHALAQPRPARRRVRERLHLHASGRHTPSCSHVLTLCSQHHPHSEFRKSPGTRKPGSHYFPGPLDYYRLSTAGSWELVNSSSAGTSCVHQLTVAGVAVRSRLFTRDLDQHPDARRRSHHARILPDPESSTSATHGTQGCWISGPGAISKRRTAT